MVAFVAQLHRIVLLAVLALSLGATGFAHRAPSVDDQAIAAMAAVGASAADICGEIGSPGRHADALCQACQIAGGADLPPRVDPGRPADLVILAASPAPRAIRAVTRVLDLSRAPQGPPLA